MRIHKLFAGCASVLKPIAAALSMFTILPVPHFPWKEDTLRYILCGFPLAGAVIGAAAGLWGAVCTALDLPPILWGAGACLLPVWISGGVHLDGFADVSDALASHAPPSRRREILHDPRCGAFAVVRLGMYFTAALSLWTALPPSGRNLGAVGCAFILSRALSGFLLLTLPVAEGSHLARAFQDHAPRRARAILGVEAAAAGLGVLAFGRLAGVWMLLAAAAAVWNYVRTAARDFEGTSGDLAGWFLQRAELWMLAALVFCQYIVR